MRLIFLITLFCFPDLSFGQDSLQIDTTLKTFTSVAQDTGLVDSASSTLKTFSKKKKTQRKKVQKFKIKEESIASKEDNTKDVDVSEKGYGLILIGALIIAVIIVLASSRSTFTAIDKQDTTSSKGEEFISDYLSREFMTRRDYYRNVYLKSEEWKRKRYVVLKRDNWRCVYCGGPATQVHHKRYAKRNIGKEPIEWLVSICKTCHDSKHL